MDKPKISKFEMIAPIIIQKYERYLPTAFDESMTLLEKTNKVIEYLNQMGLLVAKVVEDWNEVMEWTMNDGLQEAVYAKLEIMSEDGTLASLINEVIFGELNERVDYNKMLVESVHLNVKRFGAIGDGITNDSLAIQTAINFAQNAGGGEVFIPADMVCYIPDGLLISEPNITISGYGKLLQGTITIGHASVIKDMRFKILNVHIDGGDIINGVDGLRIRNSRVGLISCLFSNVTSAIYVEKVNTLTPQHTNKITIERCGFNNTNYNLFIDRNQDNGVFGVGDITFINNNPCRAFITNIYGLNVDGLTSSGNTFFQRSYRDKDQMKKNNIYLDYCNWVSIGAGDKLFEAGEEAIRIRRFENLNIVGALIAWCGQKVMSSGIRLDVGGRETATRRRGIFTITGNVISFPTKHGIELNDQTGFGTVGGNTVREAGGVSFYYGDGNKTVTELEAELATIPHYGVYAMSTTSYIEVSGNQTGSNTNLIEGIENHFANNMETGRRVPIQNRILQHYTESVIDITSHETVQFRSTSPIQVTNFTGGYSGQVLTCIAYNGNTTVVHDPTKLRLKDDVNAILPNNNATITFKLNGTVWFEIGRNF